MTEGRRNADYNPSLSSPPVATRAPPRLARERETATLQSRARPTAAGAIAHFIPTSARCHRLDPLPVKAAILAEFGG